MNDHARAVRMPADAAVPCPAGSDGILFGSFRMLPDRKLLLSRGEKVPIGARGFDMLQFLVEQRERFVGRDEIRAHVWRGLSVADNNVSVQMSRLRRCLGDPDAADAPIVSIPGRGYRFVAPLLAAAEPATRDAATDEHAPERPGPAPDAVGPRRLRRGPLALAVLVSFCLGAWLSPLPHGTTGSDAGRRDAASYRAAASGPATLLADVRDGIGPGEDDDPNR